MIYLVFYLFFYLITGRYHMVRLIVNISLYVWSLLNYFIELFHGSPFVPLDVLSFRHWSEVSDGYTYGSLVETDPRLYHVFPDLSGKQKKCQHQTEKLKFKLLAKLAPAAYIAVVVSFFLRIMLQILDTNRISGISPEVITAQVPS